MKKMILTSSSLRRLFLSKGIFFLSLIPALAQNPCEIPDIPEVTGDLTVCSGSDAVLTATTNGESVNWYSAQSGGTLLHTGEEFTLENVQENTSIWAAGINSYEREITGAARIQPASNSGAAVSAASSPWGLRFDVTKDVVINTVDVFITQDTPGVIVMQLKDAAYNVLEERMINTPAGNPEDPLQYTLELDFDVPAGTNYSLVAKSSPRMVRETQSVHGNFPYPLGDVGVITQGMLQDTPSAANATTYYFFYNWTLTVGDFCASDRTEVAIDVNNPAAPTGEEIQEFVEGQTLADLEVEGENLTWYADDQGTQSLEESTPLVDGTTYYVSQTIDGCEGEFLAVTVNLRLNTGNYSKDAIVIYPNPATDFLQISNAEEVNLVEFINTLGQVIKTFSLEQLSSELNIQDLPRGIYFVRINTSNETTTKQVILK